VSGTFSGPSPLPQSVFQSEFRHRLLYPSLRPVGSASFNRISDIFYFFLRLRAVQPLQIVRRRLHGPRAEDRLAVGISIQPGVSAGPGPVLGPFYQGGSLGVPLHVANQRHEMLVSLDRERFIAALVKVAVPHRPGVGAIALRVGQRNPLQEFRQLAVASGIKHQMPMVRHQAVSEKADGHGIQALLHDGQEFPVMRLSLEKRRTKIPPVQYVVNQAAHIHPCHSSHRPILQLLPSEKKVPDTFSPLLLLGLY